MNEMELDLLLIAADPRDRQAYISEICKVMMRKTVHTSIKYVPGEPELIEVQLVNGMKVKLDISVDSYAAIINKLLRI